MHWTEPEARESPKPYSGTGADAQFPPHGKYLRLGAIAAVILLILVLANGVRSAEEKRLTIYTPGRTFWVSVIERDRVDYVDLLAILDPLGKLDVRQEGRKWKLHLDGNESQFQEGKNKAKVRGHDFVLAQPFASDQGHPLVALTSVPLLLQGLLRVPVRYHPAGRRMFLDNVTNPFSAQLVSSQPAKLVFSFAGPVSPGIANEPGKMHIVFNRDPVIATGPDSLTFKDSAIISANYEEKNGQAEITINANAPLLASFSNGGKTLTLTPAAAVATVKPPISIPAVTPAPPAPATTSTPGLGIAARLPQRRFLVVIDPSHGGDERGAALSDTLAEKDVALALARSLRHELQVRGIEVLLLRDGDTTINTDQRAIFANTNRAALYIALHAGSVGRGVRLYTSMVPAEREPARGNFVPWDVAQGGFLDASRSAATALAGEVQARQIEVKILSASLPPLNHVAAPALGVEIAPRAGSDVNDLTSVTYQQAVASAVAAGVVTVHNRMEPVR